MVVSHVVPAPESGVHRVAKGLDPFRFRPPRSPLPEQDEPVLDGNRWDDAQGQYATLYCASSAVAAFAETIARYREVPGLLDRIDAFLSGEPDGEYDFELEPARVPDDYFADRSLGHAAIDPALRFVDVDHPDTHRSLTVPLRPVLRRHRLRVVDRGVVLSPDRRLTRPIARECWRLAQTPDHPDWAGLRYGSRLHPEWECWAAWEPSPIRPHSARVQTVTRANPDLRAAAEILRVAL
jgi:hypothetical protein